jgi:hypothetical protein
VAMCPWRCARGDAPVAVRARHVPQNLTTWESATGVRETCAVPNATNDLQRDRGHGCRVEERLRPLDRHPQQRVLIPHYLDVGLIERARECQPLAFAQCLEASVVVVVHLAKDLILRNAGTTRRARNRRLHARLFD